MTHAEFIADIQRARSFVDDRNSTMVLSLAAVDHLLAIHAAAVEMLNCRHEANTTHEIEVMIRASERQGEATNKLADLCGWKVEGA